MKARLISLLLVCSFYSVLSQTSLMQDADGKSSFNISSSQKNLAVNVNASDKSLMFSLVDDSISGNHYWGGQLKIGGKDGKFPAMKDGNATFEADLNVTFYSVINGDFDMYWYITPKFGVGRIFTIDQKTPTDPIYTNTKTSVTEGFQVGYNNKILFPHAAPFWQNFLMGAAIDFGWGDNTKRLDNLEYRQVQYSGVDKDGNPIVVTKEQKDGYASSEFKRNLFFVNPMVDIGYSLSELRLVPMIHLRYESYGSDGYGGFFTPGFGLYFTEKKNAPLKTVCGVQLFYKDVTNEKGAETSRSERATLNFVVGFKF